MFKYEYIYTLGLLYLIIFSKVLPIESHLINAFKFYIYYSTLFLTVKIAMKQKSRRNIPKNRESTIF